MGNLWLLMDTMHFKIKYKNLFCSRIQVWNHCFTFQLAHPGKAPKMHALPLCPISFVFMKFSAQIFTNNRLLAQTEGLVPPHLVWEFLDSPLIPYKKNLNIPGPKFSSNLFVFPPFLDITLFSGHLQQAATCHEFQVASQIGFHLNFLS